MIDGFEAVYGLSADTIKLPAEATATIAADAEKNASWEFLFGAPLPFTFQCSQYFSWGTVQLQLDAKSGVIHAVKAYTDAMDWQLSQTLEKVLTDCRFTLSAMQEALHQHLPQPECDDLCHMLEQQNI